MFGIIFILWESARGSSSPLLLPLLIICLALPCKYNKYQPLVQPIVSFRIVSSLSFSLCGLGFIQTSHLFFLPLALDSEILPPSCRLMSTTQTPETPAEWREREPRGGETKKKQRVIYWRGRVKKRSCHVRGKGGALECTSGLGGWFLFHLISSLLSLGWEGVSCVWACGVGVVFQGSWPGRACRSSRRRSRHAGVGMCRPCYAARGPAVPGGVAGSPVAAS